MSSTASSTIEAFADATESRLAEARLVRTGLDDYAIDGESPKFMVAPSSERDLSEFVAEADNAGVGVVPTGGRQHLSIGNLPEKYDLALSLAQMSDIVAYEPADLTVTVQPGARLADLEALLSKSKQFLPIDPPGFSEATVGGIVAANLSGPRRQAYGTIRDWLIGIRVANADGSMTKAGGRVVKNVAGYDMTKLYVGSFGTLAVISEVTFKLTALPSGAVTLEMEFTSPSAALEVLFASHDSGLGIHSAELLSPAAASHISGVSRWTLLFRVAGTSAAVLRTRQEIDRLAAKHDTSPREVDSGKAWSSWDEAFQLADLSIRVSVRPRDTEVAVETISQRLGGEIFASATASAGVIRIRFGDVPTREALAVISSVRSAVDALGGHVLVESATREVKEQIDVFGPVRSDFQIMKRLKEQMDVRRTLSCGRFLGRL